MTKPLPRRAILRALAALPMVAEQFEQAAVGATVGAQAPGAAAYALDCPPSMPAEFGSKGSEILALSKAGLLPDWFKRSLAAQVSYGRMLDPDVSCLRSLSLSAKLLVTTQRRERKALDNFEQDLVDHQMRAKFMGWQ